MDLICKFLAKQSREYVRSLWSISIWVETFNALCIRAYIVYDVFNEQKYPGPEAWKHM